MRFTHIAATLSGLLASAAASAIPVFQGSLSHNDHYHDRGNDHGHDTAPLEKRTMNVVIDMAKAVRLAEEMDASVPVGKRVAEALNAATDTASFEDDNSSKEFFETVTKRFYNIVMDGNENDDSPSSDGDTDGLRMDDTDPEDAPVPDAPEFPEGEPVVVDKCEDINDPCGGVPE